MTEVAEEIEFSVSTIVLATNILFKYLSIVNVRKEDLQEVGITALWIAAKYEEVTPLDAGDLADLTAGATNVRKMNATEEKILRVLDFDVSFPTSWYFLKHFIVSIDKNISPQTMGSIQKYSIICERVSLRILRIFRNFPSKIAAACLYLGRKTTFENLKIDETVWNDDMIEITGYIEPHIIPVVDLIYEFQRQLKK